MTNYQIFKAAHAKARMIVKVLNNYRAAFSVALKEVYQSMKKAQIVGVTIERLEGFSEQCIERKFRNLQDADKELFTWSFTAPENGGYDKCSFMIEWSDGTTYTGRYDLKHYTHGGISILKHVKDYLNYLAGGDNGFKKSYQDDAKEWLVKYF